jgi:hypothetical protein
MCACEHENVLSTRYIAPRERQRVAGRQEASGQARQSRGGSSLGRQDEATTVARATVGGEAVAESDLVVEGADLEVEG